MTAGAVDTAKNGEKVVLARGERVSALMIQYRSAFGIFASEGFADTTHHSSDPVEVLIAVLALLMLTMKYNPRLTQWKSTSQMFDTFSHSWRVASVVVEVIDLLESVLIFLGMRLLTDLAELSVGAAYTSGVATVRSLILFLAISCFVQARQRVPTNMFRSADDIAAILDDPSKPRHRVFDVWLPFF